MWCTKKCDGQGVQPMVDVSARPTAAEQFTGGISFVALLEETFKTLADAHAAELRRVQLGGALRTSSPDGDTAVQEWFAVAASAVEVAVACPQEPGQTSPSPPDDAFEAPSTSAPTNRGPAMGGPTDTAPQAAALGSTSRLDGVPAADDKRASNGGHGGEDTLPPCRSNTTPEDAGAEIDEKSSNAVPALDAPVTLSQKAMHSNIKFHALEITISGAGDLRDADFMPGAGASDPYCVCQVKGKPDTRLQTRAINDSCHPVWNHHCVIEDFEEGDTLEFIVFDRDVGLKEDDVLGWVDMDSHTHFPQGFDGVLNLHDPKKHRSQRSTLTVKVVARGLVVAPDDNRALAALQLQLDAGAKLWPELFPGCQLKQTLQSAATADVSSGTLMASQFQRSMSTVHGTVIRERGRLQRAIVMNPHSSSQGFWDLLSVCCVFFDIFHVPFVLAFETEPVEIKTFSGATTIFWTLDLLRSFLCGYYHGGIVEMRLKPIAMRYLKSWFLMDFVLVSLDWGGLLLATEATIIPKMMRVLHIVRAVRALNVVRIAKLMARIERLSYGVRAESMRALLGLTACMLAMIIGCHLLACGFYRLGRLYTQQGTPGWVLRDEVDAQGSLYSYTTSMHWAFTQFMPASSGINPGNEYERGYTLLVDILGFVCFSFFVSNVQMQLQGIKKLTADKRHKMALLRRFFTDHHISLQLSNTIFSFIKGEDAAKRRTLRESEVEVLKTLPKAMQVQLRFEMYGAMVKSHPFFMGLMDVDMICARRLCHGAMTEIGLAGGEEVFVQGNRAHSMYFVLHGHLLYKRPDLSFKLEVGDWACEPVLWFPSWTHRGNLHTVGAADLLQVSAATFAALVFSPNASTVRMAYVQLYAAAFVRGGESDVPMLQHSDMWGEVAAIDVLAMQCMRRAPSVRESQVAGLWRESAAGDRICA